MKLYVACLCLAASFTAAAQEPLVTAHGQVTVGNQTLHYTTQAGLLPIYRNETAELAAKLFVTAYTLDRAPGQPMRPLIFLWQGGPGANSSDLQLLGVGPKGLKTPDTFPEWPAHPPEELIDRADTWLPIGDLVFIDPPGTGYSRATTDANRDLLYTTHGDGEAVAEAIRVYRTRYNAWDQPVFLVGESYGAERAAVVAEALERRHTHVAGVLLISGDYDVGQPHLTHAMDAALHVPTLSLAAYYHKRALQQLSAAEVTRRASDWARTDYAAALEHPEKADRTRVLAKLKELTGIESQYVDSKSLILSPESFADHAVPYRELGRYDLRMAGPKRGADNPVWIPTLDASIVPVLDIMNGNSAVLVRYIRDTLGFKSDLLYMGPFGNAFHPEPLRSVAPQISGPYDDWMTFKFNKPHGEKSEAGPPVKHPPPLRRAMDLNERLQVMVAQGRYDADVDTCAVKEEQVAQTDPALRRRVRNYCYEAGHMVYTDVGTRKALLHDFDQFVRDATTAGAAKGRIPSSP